MNKDERYAQRVEFGGRLIAIGQPHGSPHTYTNWGCRCEACTKASSDYGRARRHKKIREAGGIPGVREKVVKHRTNGTDYNAGCRCEFCTVAHRVRTARRRAERFAARVEINGALVAVGRKHGSASTYRNWGCRCEACTRVHSAACSNYQQRRKTWSE